MTNPTQAGDVEATQAEDTGSLIDLLKFSNDCDAPGRYDRKCGKCYNCQRRRAADKIEKQAMEIENLKHDINRHLAIINDYAVEIQQFIKR